MLYVIKVGEYYVSSIGINTYISSIELSKETMRTFTKQLAETVSSKINGEIIKLDCEEI